MYENQFMNTQHLIIGIIGVCWSSGMIYFSQAKKVPSIVKPFIYTWWIKSEKANQLMALIFGIGGVIGGIIFIIGGLTGRKIFPFP